MSVVGGYSPPDPMDNPTASAGFAGLRRYQGYVVDDPLAELHGSRGIDLWTEMGTDPTVAAMLWALTLMIRQVQWQVRPADDSARAREIADHVDACLADMGNQTWPSAISSIASFLQYGWSWHELSFKKRSGPDPSQGEPSRFNDGRWGLAQIGERSQPSLLMWLFESDDDDRLLGMSQISPTTSRVVDLSAARSLHVVTTSARGNPEGRSVLRSAVRPWRYRWRLEEFEAIGIERDLAGLPVADVPAEMLSATATAEQLAMVEKIRATLRAVRRATTEGLIWPYSESPTGKANYTFRLMASGGTRQFDITAAVARYDRQILLAGLTDFMLLGHEGTSGLGVTSIGATKVDLLNAALEAFVDAIAAEVSAKAFGLLTRLNGWPPELTPTLGHGKVQAIDLPAIAEYVAKLSAAGAPIFPSAPLEQYLHEIADLPYDPEAAGTIAEMVGEANAAAAAARPGSPTAPSTKELVDALAALVRSGADPESAAAAIGLPPMKWTGAIPVTLRPTVDDASALEGGTGTTGDNGGPATEGTTPP